MNRISNEQREAIVRRAVAERDAALVGEPMALERIRAAIAADRCDGDTEYAAGVNAACQNHLALIDRVLAEVRSTLGVSASDHQEQPGTGRKGEAQPFAKGSWQHAVDDHIVDYGRTSQEFATPHEAVQWLLKQTVEATLAVPTHPAPRGPLTTAELMAQEYEQWIRFHDAGNGDFTGFLRLVTAANNKAQAHGISTTQERSSHDAS